MEPIIILQGFMEKETLDEYEEMLTDECLRSEYRDFMQRWQEEKDAKRKAKSQEN